MKIAWMLTAAMVMASWAAAEPPFAESRPARSVAVDADLSNQVLELQGHPQHGYVEIASDPALDTPQMTVEAWVAVRDPRAGACSSIVGNGYTTGWWVGLCGTSMRSYFNGSGSAKTGGAIPDTPGAWVHIAAVTDGTTRRHYINGYLVLESAETAAIPASTKPVRIGSDPDWDYMAAGTIDDLRIWSVARTQTQIRQTMYVRPVPPVDPDAFQSLEAWYSLDGNALDSWRTHHGTIVGAGTGFEARPVFEQPANQYLGLHGYPEHGYIEIPFDAGLDTPEMTVEAWVSVKDARTTACSSIAGSGYITGWWLGVCGTSMRSYFNGTSSVKTGGTIPDTPDTWVHIAAVTDGSTRRHYINGALVFESAETAPSQASEKPVRIGSDPDWDYMALGGVDELRIWSSARTQTQILQTMHLRPTTPANEEVLQSLEAWYSFEGNAMDSRRMHHGTISGTGTEFMTGNVFSGKRRAAAH